MSEEKDAKGLFKDLIVAELSVDEKKFEKRFVKSYTITRNAYEKEGNQRDPGFFLDKIDVNIDWVFNEFEAKNQEEIAKALGSAFRLIVSVLPYFTFLSDAENKHKFVEKLKALKSMLDDNGNNIELEMLKKLVKRFVRKNKRDLNKDAIEFISDCASIFA